MRLPRPSLKSSRGHAGPVLASAHDAEGRSTAERPAAAVRRKMMQQIVSGSTALSRRDHDLETLPATPAPDRSSCSVPQIRAENVAEVRSVGLRNISKWLGRKDGGEGETLAPLSPKLSKYLI